MPSLSEATPAQWARMRASTSLSSYQLLDRLREAKSLLTVEDLTALEKDALPDLLAGELVETGQGEHLFLTGLGRRF